MGLDKGHGAEVLVRNMATGEMRSISTDADPPALSPDGRLIAYNFWGRDLLSVGDRGALRVIANEAGSRPRIIVSNPPDVRYFSPAAFSPDSKSLLVIVVHQDWTRQLAWVSVADGNVRVLKSLGWSLRGVDGKPSVSPDGRFIAYSALAVSPSSQSGPINPTDQNIYILASDGSVQNTVVQGTNINHSPQWTPDGTRLLFLSNRRGNGFDLWSVVVQSGRAASEPPSLLRELSGTTNAIGMTRQGSFYYMNTQTESDDIFAVDLNPSTAKVLSPPTRVPLNLVGSNRGPSWSPDGNFLAFKRRHSGTSTSYDLVIQSLKTKQEQTITTGFTMGGRAVQWFHHSNEVLHPGGWRINLETKEVKQIPHLPNSNLSYSGLLQLSPDDKVYFVAAGEKASAAGVAGAMNRIAVIDVNSGQEVRVLELNEMATIFGIALSPDGRTLAVKGRPKQLRTPGRKSDFEVQLARIGIDGSDYNVLYAPFLIQQAAWGETLTWTKDGKAILFGESGEFSTPDFGINHIMRIPAEGGMPEPTGLQGTSEGTLNLDLNVDGSKAIFNNLETPLSDLWRIDIDKVSSTSKNAH
jgi:Tol biopolymer transport system component